MTVRKPKPNRRRSSSSPTRRSRPPAFKLVERAAPAVAGQTLRAGAERRALDPIEIASRDANAALQPKGLKWTLQHADKRVPHYLKEIGAAGQHLTDFE